MVVLVLALLLTVLANAPVLYLALAEQSNGQIDLLLAQNDRRLNWTLASETASRQGDQWTYGSPRLEFSALVEKQTSSTPMQGFSIDESLELRAGVGRDFVGRPKLQSGEIYMSNLLAGSLGNVSIGDTVNIVTRVRTVFGVRVWEEMTSGDSSQDDQLVVVVMIKGFYSGSAGKHPSGVSGVLLPGDAWPQMMAEGMNPSRSDPEVRARVAAHPWREYANRVVWNLPPGRAGAYRSSDLAGIKRDVSGFISELLARVGWKDISTTMPVLDGVSGYEFFSLFLGLLLNIIVLFIFALSVLLIYSLLMVSVESRTFELGILRMVGMTRPRLVGLLLTQALFYALPAIVIGLPVAQGFAVPISIFLENLSGVEVSPLLTGLSIGMAILAGLLVPLVGAILPVREALRANVHSSVDTRRSKTVAVRYKLTRSDSAVPSGPLLVIGLVLFGLAFVVYYLLPLALLATNLYALLNIFFLVLIAMLVGLTVLASNLQPLLERLFTWIFFFWEHSAIRSLTLRNFDAHRRRNRNTALMFSVSLAFILFLSVTFSVQLNSLVAAKNQDRASTLSLRVNRNRYEVDSEPGAGLPVKAIDDWARTQPNVIEVGWATMPLQWHAKLLRGAGLEGIGHTFRFSQNIIGVSPNLFNASFKGYVKLDSGNSFQPLPSIAERILEQLYSRRGSHSVLAGSNWIPSLGQVAPLDGSRPPQDLLLWKSISSPGTPSLVSIPGAGAALGGSASATTLSRTRLATEAWLTLAPLFSFSGFPSGDSDDVLVSLPAFVRLLRSEADNTTLSDVDQLSYETCLLRFTDNTTSRQITEVKRSLTSAISESGARGVEVIDTRDATDSLETAEQLVGFFFLFTVVIGLVICFFSLSSSMSTNILEQRKEIGVLLALGMKSGWIRRIYIWEAILVVFSASALGIGIGVLVAFTFTLQQALFTQLPIPFEFPWVITIAVIILSVIFGVIASIGPLYQILKASPVQILRDA